MRLLPVRFYTTFIALLISTPVQAAMSRDDFLANMLKSRPYMVIEENRIHGEDPEFPDSAGKRTISWRTERGRIQLEIQPLKDQDLQLQFSLQSSSGASLSDTIPNIDGWGFELPLVELEYISGVFERVVDGPQEESWRPGVTTAMNLNGERVEMKVNYTVSAYAPFFLSSESYGLYFQGTWPGVFDFGKTDKNRLAIQFEGPSLGFRFISGSPMRIVQTHSLLAGPAHVPPRWAFGPWRWRDENHNNPNYFDGTAAHTPYNTSLVEDILLMRAYDIPLSAYWIDRPWGPGSRGYDNFDWDPERFPEAQGMIDWLGRKDIALMLWIAPFVMDKMADYAEQHSYHLESKPWWNNSRQVLMDFSNEEASRWWGENGPAKLARQGIKGFKMDRADGEKLRDDPDLYTADKRSYRENYNDYPRQYVKAAYDAVQPILGDDFVLFPRAQYTGSSRYGAMWAGDTGGSEWGLRSAVVALLRCSLMGYPVWGSDTGGYHAQDFDQKVFTRWLGFSAFSPIMEVGPTVDRGIWDLPDEPHYNPEVIAAWRFYSKIKTALIGYSHAAALEANQLGTPIAKPLYLQYPDQPQAWQQWETYLYGNDLLVSAVWETGKTRHSVYLPAGEQWTDLWTGEIHAGGQQLEVPVPLYKIPVFLKQGSSLQLPDFQALWQESLAIAASRPDLTALEEKEIW